MRRSSSDSVFAIILATCSLGLLNSTAAAQTYFYNRADFLTGYAPIVVAIGDFNGDGKPDLAVLNDSTKTVSILLGRPDGTFQVSVAYPTGNEPQAMVIVDFNGDGKVDLAVANRNDNTVSIYLGNGDGTFQPKVDYPTTPGPAALAVGDLNGDGKLDLIVLNGNSHGEASSGFYSILLGNGDGTFQSHMDYPTVNFPSDVKAADVNGDGKLDLVISDSGYDGVSQVCVYPGQGDGTFGPGSCYATGMTPVAVAVADVNSDGKLDLITANYSGSVSVLLGNGDGTFQSHIDYAAGGGLEFLTVDNLNGDGTVDLVTANQISNNISVLLGNGDGTFQPHVDYGAGDFPTSVAVADFNGDGRKDLAIANYSTTTVTVLLGKGDGTFVSPTNYPTDTNPEFVTVGDLNRDGKPDMVVANADSNTISVFLGNGDGTFQPKVDYPTGNTPSSVVIADFNRDGNPDVAVSYRNCPNSLCSTGGVSILLGNGDGTLQSHVDYPASGTPMSIATGDFNGDKNLDLVTANYGPGTISILLGNGDGTFQTHQDYTTGEYLAPVSVAIGDFNGDQKLDLAVANYTDGESGLSILLGKGDGTFLAPVNLTPACSEITCVVIAADFNRDGKMDLVSGEFIWLGNGDGTFQSPKVISLRGMPIIAGDFNGDGKPDLAAVTGFGCAVECAYAASLLLGHGDGTFGPSINFNSLYGPTSMAAADFNGDGALDFAFTNSSASTNILSVVLSSSTLALYPDIVDFGDQLIQTTSLPLSVSLSNPGIVPLAVNSVTAGGDFTQENGCPTGSVLAAGSNCTVEVSFTPAATGPQSGSLVFSDDAIGATQVISLAGIGTAPVASLTVTSLPFSAQLVGTTSASQTVTLSNAGTAPLTISTTATSGDFSETNTCGASVAAPGSCTITVRFTPTATGTRTGALTITDNNNGVNDSVQTVILTGTGVVPVAGVSAGSLPFSNEPVGTASPSQTVTLNNTGNAALTIASIAANGDFSETNTCGTSVTAGGNCPISVTFTPTAEGSRSGTLTITDNNNGVAGSTQTVALSGTGLGPVASPSPGSLTFTNQLSGTTSGAQTVTLTNTGNAALTITSIAANGDFSETNTCGASVAAGGNCPISVTFKPTAGGSRSGTLTITDNNEGVAGSTQTVTLTGTGQDFSLTVPTGSSSSATVTPGQTATYALSLSGLGGMNQSINFTCTGAPSEATCTVNPTSATPNASGSIALTVSVTTMAASLAAPPVPRTPPFRFDGAGKLVALLLLGLLMWASLEFGRDGRKARRSLLRLGLLGTALLALALVMAACGGGGGGGGGPQNPGTPAGTYPLTVTGTVSGLQHSTTLTLTVN